MISHSDHEDPLQWVPRRSGITIIWLFTTIMTPSYAIGLFFIACVTIIWSLASIVVQFLYTDEKFNSPFLLTYIGTTLFTLFLPTRLLWERFNCGTLENDVFPWKAETTYETIPAVMMEASFDRTIDKTLDRTTDKTIDKTIDKTLDRGLEHEELFHNNNNDDDDDRMPHMTASSQPKVPSDYTLMSHQEHLMIALKIAPIWFIGNWAYNASLAYTSITSSTVLASTGSVFTFLFAVSWGDEQFTHLKLLGVLLGVTGSILTGWHDIQSFQSAHGVDYSNLTSTSLTPNDHFELQAPMNPWESHAIWGDILGLLSAIGYGTYTVMIRLLCPRDERCMSMQLLLGYIGLLNAVALFPMALYVLFFQTNAQRLTVIVLGYLVAQGLLDNVLSDYLWARAVLLTSATVATVGLGLTIPLAFVSDWILGNMQESSILSVLGAISVLVGFVVVNVESDARE